MQQLEKTKTIKQLERKFTSELEKIFSYFGNNYTKEYYPIVSVKFGHQSINDDGSPVHQYFSFVIEMKGIFGVAVEKLIEYLKYPTGTLNGISVKDNKIRIDGTIWNIYKPK